MTKVVPTSTPILKEEESLVKTKDELQLIINSCVVTNVWLTKPLIF